jgi:hypothetical protein
MNDTWINKDEKAIGEDVLKIAKEETGLTSFKSVGVLRGIIEVVNRVVVFIYRTAINPVYRNASLDGAAGFFLSMWGLMLGVVRKQEEKTEGAFTGTADGPGRVPAGAWIVLEGTELRYRVKEGVSFAAGDFAIPVAAEFPGSAYNVGAGIPLRITRTIPGLESVSVGDGWITVVGQDVEEDEPYRERIKTRWRDQTLGDTKDTYKYYAEKVTGVRSARIIRAPRGPGSTDVVIAAVNGAPDTALLEAVRASLRDHELMAFDVQVKPPGILSINIEIEYSGDASEGEVSVIADEYARGLGIGGRFRVGRLYDLYEPLEQKTLEIISPARDVQPAENELVEAVITVTKAA